jgi:hypothetical protein
MSAFEIILMGLWLISGSVVVFLLVDLVFYALHLNSFLKENVYLTFSMLLPLFICLTLGVVSKILRVQKIRIYTI